MSAPAKNIRNIERLKTKQGGFAGVVFLVIALIAVIMGAIAAMSRNNTSGLPEQNARTMASVILKQAADLKTGFDRMVIDGFNPANITFTAIGANGLFTNNNGVVFAVPQIPPGASVTPGNVPAFNLNNAVNLPGIGADGTADTVFVIGNLTGEVCRQINRILYNDGPNAAPVASAGALAAWATTPAAVNDGASTALNYDGRPEGCVAASDGPFVYYKAAAEN